MKAALLVAFAVSCTACAVQVSAQARKAYSEPALRAITGELTEKLDSKSARVGDRVVIKTKSSIRMADGREIPKGSQLVAHVAGAKSAGGGDANAQIALAFDRAELKDGPSIPIRAEIESIAAADSSSGSSEPIGPAPTNGSAGRAAGDMYGSTPSAVVSTQTANSAGSSGSVKESVAGAIVAHSGDLILRATAIPGLLVANHAAASGNARAPSILLAAHRDIVLEAGARILIEIDPAIAQSAGTK
jgi:hypothetical protein